jgi:hypothetical protein
VITHRYVVSWTDHDGERHRQRFEKDEYIDATDKFGDLRAAGIPNAMLIAVTEYWPS